MRKFSLILSSLFILFSLVAEAGNVTPEEALKIAQDFMASKNVSFSVNKTLAKSYSADAMSKGYYVFNNDNESGFVIVASEDRVPMQILGYSDKGHFNVDNMPSNVKAWMDQYTEQIIPLLKNDPNVKLSGEKAPMTAYSVAPLIKSEWDQIDPYNRLCPTYKGQRCYTGCVATAMAQVMYYHKWPAKGKGYVSYTTDELGIKLSRDLSQSTYDWSSMRDTYNSSSPKASGDAVAVLMRDCGYAVDMDYTPNGSGAWSNAPLNAFVNHFDYNANTIRYAWRNSWSDSEWFSVLRNELNNKRPIVYGGYGHEFVVDGYTTTGYFHINFGWSGECDGDYSLNQILYGWYNASMVYGIKPNGKIEPNVPVTKIDLDQTSATIKDNESVQLKATVSPSNATNKSVKWSSNNTNVATVTSNGLVKGVSEGTATITCTSVENSKISTTCKVTVKSSKIPVKSMTLSKTSLTIKDNETAQLTVTINPNDATDKSVTWTSSDKNIATVSSKGVITPKAVGKATITCTSNSNTKISKTCKLTVNTSKIAVKSMTLSKTSLTIKDNETAQLTVTINPKDATDPSVTWTSSDKSIATVSKKGIITPKKEGKVNITCTSNSNTKISKTCKVTVKSSKVAVTKVKLNKTTLSLKEGATEKLVATLSPTDATDKTVEWKSSDESVATVAADGTVTAIKAGKATITCSSVSTPSKYATCKVTVTSANKTRGISTLEEEAEPVVEAEKTFDVYNLRGVKVRQNVKNLDGLPRGLYIINGKKVFKRE